MEARLKRLQSQDSAFGSGAAVRDEAAFRPAGVNAGPFAGTGK